MYNCLEGITAGICGTLRVVEVKERLCLEACSHCSASSQIPKSQVTRGSSAALGTRLHDEEFVQGQSLAFPWDKPCHASSLLARCLPALQWSLSPHRCSKAGLAAQQQAAHRFIPGTAAVSEMPSIWGMAVPIPTHGAAGHELTDGF